MSESYCFFEDWTLTRFIRTILGFLIALIQRTSPGNGAVLGQMCDRRTAKPNSCSNTRYISKGVSLLPSRPFDPALVNAEATSVECVQSVTTTARTRTTTSDPKSSSWRGFGDPAEEGTTMTRTEIHPKPSRCSRARAFTPSPEAETRDGWVRNNNDMASTDTTILTPTSNLQAWEEVGTSITDPLPYPTAGNGALNPKLGRSSHPNPFAATTRRSQPSQSENMNGRRNSIHTLAHKMEVSCKTSLDRPARSRQSEYRTEPSQDIPMEDHPMPDTPLPTKNSDSREKEVAEFIEQRTLKADKNHKMAQKMHRNILREERNGAEDKINAEAAIAAKRIEILNIHLLIRFYHTIDHISSSPARFISPTSSIDEKVAKGKMIQDLVRKRHEIIRSTFDIDFNLKVDPQEAFLTAAMALKTTIQIQRDYIYYLFYLAQEEDNNNVLWDSHRRTWESIEQRVINAGVWCEECSKNQTLRLHQDNNQTYMLNLFSEIDAFESVLRVQEIELSSKLDPDRPFEAPVVQEKRQPLGEIDAPKKVYKWRRIKMCEPRFMEALERARTVECERGGLVASWRNRARVIKRSESQKRAKVKFSSDVIVRLLDCSH